MSRRLVNLTLDTLEDLPRSCRMCVYWELDPVWDAIATAFSWRRVEPLTVREARRLGFEARVAPSPRDEEKGAAAGQ